MAQSTQNNSNVYFEEDKTMYFRSISLSIALLIMLTGCLSNQEATEQGDKRSDSYMHLNNSNRPNDQALNQQEIADHLAHIASDIPHVNGANAIVVGPYALVGIDVAKDLDRSRVGTVKYTVSEALQHDDFGKTAVVVADGDILERIRLMREHIQNGQPIQGVIEELSAIIGRYMPDFPTPEKKSSDQNKKILDDKDEQELDKIERDQSKN